MVEFVDVKFVVLCIWRGVLSMVWGLVVWLRLRVGVMYVMLGGGGWGRVGGFVSFVV